MIKAIKRIVFCLVRRVLRIIFAVHLDIFDGQDGGRPIDEVEQRSIAPPRKKIVRISRRRGHWANESFDRLPRGGPFRRFIPCIRNSHSVSGLRLYTLLKRTEKKSYSLFFSSIISVLGNEYGTLSTSLAVIDSALIP